MNDKITRKNRRSYWRNTRNRFIDLFYIVFIITTISLGYSVYTNTPSNTGSSRSVSITGSTNSVPSSKIDITKVTDNVKVVKQEEAGCQLVHYKGLVVDKRALQYQYALTVESTAYWVMDPVDASGTGIAADGTKAVPWKTIAVDPKVIPLQSKVYIPGVGWCRANDTGSAIKGNIIDMATESKASAYKWGRKKGLEIIVIPPNRYL